MLIAGPHLDVIGEHAIGSDVELGAAVRDEAGALHGGVLAKPYLRVSSHQKELPPAGELDPLTELDAQIVADQPK